MTPGPTAVMASLRRIAAFSLLELVVVLAVLAVLAGLALPGYQNYLARAHRAEAVRALLEIAACQERLRADLGGYRPAHCLPTNATPRYRFYVEPGAQGAGLDFRAVAEPIGAQARDRCGALSLDQAGRREVAGEGASGPDCWGGR